MVKEKERLQAERARILEEIAYLKDLLKGEVENELEEGDPGLYEREKNLALLQNLEYRLESIDYALRLIEKGSYGICEVCGEKIDPARLKAVPHATLCIKCQAKKERGG